MARLRVRPNQRMKLSWRGGRLKGNLSCLRPPHHAAYARSVRRQHIWIFLALCYWLPAQCSLALRSSHFHAHGLTRTLSASLTCSNFGRTMNIPRLGDGFSRG